MELFGLLWCLFYTLCYTLHKCCSLIAVTAEGWLAVLQMQHDPFMRLHEFYVLASLMLAAAVTPSLLLCLQVYNVRWELQRLIQVCFLGWLIDYSLVHLRGNHTLCCCSFYFELCGSHFAAKHSRWFSHWRSAVSQYACEGIYLVQPATMIITGSSVHVSDVYFTQHFVPVSGCGCHLSTFGSSNGHSCNVRRGSNHQQTCHHTWQPAINKPPVCGTVQPHVFKM